MPNIFSYEAFKRKFRSNHQVSIDLQSLLTSTLQQRLQLFSREFSSTIWHELAGCKIEDKLIEINPNILPFKQFCFDLVCSAGPLMLTNDAPGILKQWSRALKPGGVFFASFVGENTLSELKNCFFKMEDSNSGLHHFRFLPTITTKDAGMLMQRAGFYLPTADCTRHSFKIDSFSDLLGGLKALGGNILCNKPNTVITKSFLKAVEEEYFNSYSCDGQLIVSVDIVCMTGWVKNDEKTQVNGMKYL